VKHGGTAGTRLRFLGVKYREWCMRMAIMNQDINSRPISLKEHESRIRNTKARTSVGSLLNIYDNIARVFNRSPTM